MTRTEDEFSVVCQQDVVPEGVACERGWRCLRVAGALPLSAVGILARLTALLAEADGSPGVGNGITQKLPKLLL